MTGVSTTNVCWDVNIVVFFNIKSTNGKKKLIFHLYKASTLAMQTVIGSQTLSTGVRWVNSTIDIQFEFTSKNCNLQTKKM